MAGQGKPLGGIQNQHVPQGQGARAALLCPLHQPAAEAVLPPRAQRLPEGFLPGQAFHGAPGVGAGPRAAARRPWSAGSGQGALPGVRQGAEGRFPLASCSCFDPGASV